MVRTSYVVFVLGLAVAACGGGSNNTTHACGDGHVDSGEECDDGNTTSNDGCSALCKIETSVCGDGITDVATEQCDDGNTVSGDGCSANCQRETVAPMNCGNGVMDAGETCDDHNMIAGDGCSATCQTEAGYVCTGSPSVCMIPPMSTGGTCAAPADIPLTGTTALVGMVSGDTTIGTSMVGEADCVGFEADGDGTDNVWSFTLPAARDVKIVLNPEFDGLIRLLTTPCDLTTGIATTANALSCEDEGLTGEPEMLSYTALPAGTYYLIVDSWESEAFGAYTLAIQAVNTVCGDGIVSGSEICDDGNTTAGDGCGATCQTEAGYDCGTAEPSVCVLTCGNNHLDAGEECDDGNTVAGDRCSPTCTLEFDIAEVEPNNTVGQVITPAHHQIKGALPANDYDLYKFTLTSPATVEFETYDSMDPDSAYEGFADNLPDVDCKTISTTLTLFDATGTFSDDTTGLYMDDFDGDFDDDSFATCGYIGPDDFDGDTMQGVLQPGTYTIKVEETNNEAATRYILDMKITPM